MHAHTVKTINVSGKMFPHKLDVLLKLTVHSSVLGSGATVAEDFTCKRGLYL